VHLTLRVNRGHGEPVICHRWDYSLKHIELQRFETKISVLCCRTQAFIGEIFGLGTFKGGINPSMYYKHPDSNTDTSHIHARSFNLQIQNTYYIPVHRSLMDTMISSAGLYGSTQL
jgi:hypothetical protein